MKRSHTVSVILLILLLYSCENDKSRIEKCNEIVKTFIANLPLDNYEILYKQYPDFQHVKKYWKVNDFVITNTTIDENKAVSVIGSSQLGNILFNLKKVNDRYIITSSKGLAAVFNSPLYKYCKKIGCIKFNDYDANISQICSEKENEFNRMVQHAKEKIESDFKIENNNLSNSFNYVSGDVTVKNNSRFSIPGHSYEIYFHFLNLEGQVAFTTKAMFNFENIGYGQSVTEHLYESNSHDFQKIKVELKLISIKFIEEVIADNAEGSNCVVSSNF